MYKNDLVKCFLSSSDGVARWALQIGYKTSSLSSLELDQKTDGLVESISIVFRTLLEREKINVFEIDEIVFILGPGSFTSLRTSYSFLRGLISPKKIKLTGISSFLAFLLSTKLQSLGKVKLCLKANHQENFVAHFFVKSQTSVSATSPEAQSIEISNDSSCINVPEVILPDTLVDASYYLSRLDEDSINSLHNAGHLSTSSELCELLYIKGVAAKTLVERGVA